MTATSQSLPGTSTTAPTTEALSNASTALTAEESSSVPATSSALPELTQDEAGLYQLGNYSCSPTVTLNRLDDILEAYLDDSDLTTDATITYLVLNLHAAADPFSPSTPAQKPPPFQMPHDETLISHIINGNLSNKVIYTPQELREDRKDLNASWFDVQWDNKPAAGYYNTSQDKDDQYSTDDGWPTETFIEFGEFQRILVGFGDVDPQMEDYNLSADGGVIFGPNELFKNHKTTYGSSGNIRSGCLYSSASPNRAPSPLTANTSWALSTFPPPKLSANPNTTNPIPSINSLTTCGLSPYLNTSLANNLTADDHPTPYLAITHSTLWSWAPGEPKNSTNPDNHSSSRNTCAVISSSGAYPGRWRTADCRVSRRIACQSLSSPWTWHISSQTATYRHAFDIESSLCPAGYHFSVPHTALENRYLSSALSSSPSPNTEKTEIFVNINSLDTPQCWTLGGPNATCPYMPRVRMNQARIVVIPTIAAVIIFVLAALTFFVKCASNRREMRRGKRRREGWGWEYEGVPS